MSTEQIDDGDLLDREVYGRVRKLLANAGSQKDVAASIGVSVPTLQRILSGNAEISVGRLMRIADVLGVDTVSILDPAKVATETLAVPEIDLAYGMGGTFIDDLSASSVTRDLPVDWIRAYTRASAEHLFLCRGIGDSMMPTLLDSDLLLVDRSQDTLKQSDRLWVVMVGEVGMVKRVRVQPNGNLTILSDNENVPPMEAVDGEAVLIGRVVAVIRKM